MRRLAVYSDAEHLGGHEIQLLSALKGIKNQYEIVLLINKENKAFISRVRELGLSVSPCSCSVGRFEFFLRFFRFLKVLRVFLFLKVWRPEALLVAQGNVEKGGVAVIAARLAKVKCISYIPSAHFLVDVSKSRFWGRVKDFINILNYRLCGNYITINGYNRDLIRRRSATARVVVVNNGIDFKRLDESSGLELEVPFGRNGRRVYLIVGRMEIYNKGQDLILECLSRYPDAFREADFVFCGSGKDADLFKRLIEFKSNIFFYEHVDNIAMFYRRADVVVIPSRFEAGEGTPMVLLEALYMNKPVLMSALPGADMYLDKRSLFSVGSVEALADSLKAGLFDSKGKGVDVVSLHSEASMIKNFSGALSSFL